VKDGEETLFHSVLLCFTFFTGSEVLNRVAFLMGEEGQRKGRQVCLALALRVLPSILEVKHFERAFRDLFRVLSLPLHYKQQ
jgi:hypothetical protein